MHIKNVKRVTLSFILFVCRRQRLPAKNVYYYRCPDHRRNYVMSFAFCFDREDDVYQFAYCYPYTYSRLQHYLASLERRNLDYLRREQLGFSVVSRCMRCSCVCVCLPCVISLLCYRLSVSAMHCTLNYLEVLDTCKCEYA